MIQSIWFCIGALFLYFAIMYLKKIDEKQNGIIWLIMTGVIIMCYHAFVAGVLNLAKVPINLWSMGFCDIFLAIVLLCVSLRRGLSQTYYWRKIDVLVILLMFAVALLLGIRQFNLNLNLNYASVDGSTHYRIALEVLKKQKVEGMLFSSTNNALFLGIFVPFIKATRLYHIFVLLDIIMFFASGAVFYCTIAEKILGKWSGIIAVIISCLYMLGYPYNNLIFGFNYLGMSIMLAIYLIWSTRYYLTEKMEKNYSIILIALGCYSIGVCYSLFAPVAFIGVCIAIFFHNYGKRKSNEHGWLLNFVIDCLKVFLVPFILVAFYSVFGYFGEQGSDNSFSSGISREGGIYRDLYSNFIFWIPFVVYDIYLIIKRRINNLEIYYLSLMVIFMIVLGYGGMVGKVSSYYYYKTYFFMSAIVFLMSYDAMLYLIEKNKPFTLISIGTYLMCGIVAISGIEGKIQNRNYLFAPSTKYMCYFDIYCVNNILSENIEDYSDAKMDLYEFCSDEFPLEDYEQVIICSQLEDQNVFRGITQRLDENDYIFWKYLSESEAESLGIKDKPDFGAYFSQLQSNDKLKEEMPFVFLYSSKDLYDSLMDYKGEDIEILYQNPSGFVAIMKNCILE